MKHIAVLGLGIMGHGIADNFLKHGYEVTVWNRSPDKADDLVARGATLAASVADAVAVADLVFEVTANDESSRELWLGADGIVSHSNAGQTLITCATLSVEWVDELAAACLGKDLTFFDMPMTGGRQGAESGQLILLVGGNAEKLNGVKPHLEAVASQVKYFGPAGHGMRFKLVLNALQSVHIAAFGEAVRLSKALGIDVQIAGDALAERPGGISTNLAWRDYQQHPDPINFSVEWIAKDDRYALRNVSPGELPIMEDTLAYLEKAIASGHKDDDWTCITR